MYKLFLTLRYLRKRRIAYFAIAAVTLCTAMVLIVMSVMGGFLDQLKTKARGLLGDIIVDNLSYSGFPLYEEFIADVSQWTDEAGRPRIVQATPVIYSWGLLNFRGTPETHTVRVVGLRLQEVYNVNAFKSGLYYETYYPGTTTLGEQRQPLLGRDLSAKPVEWYDAKGEPLDLALPPPMLPPPYQDALERAYTAGIVDTESPDTEITQTCKQAGLAPIVGQYEPLFGPGGLQPPQMEGDPLPGLIIGRDIVATRMPDGEYARPERHPRGRMVTLTLLPVSDTGELDTPIKKPFRYADDSRTGIYEIDSKHVYCDFELLQQLLFMGEAERVDPLTLQTVGVIPARCHQIQIKVAPGVDPYKLAAELERHYHSFADDARFRDRLGLNERQLIRHIKVKTWEQSQEHIIAPVEKERQLVTILFGIISLVAAVLVLCILYMIVLQRTRDIGIVKALGGSSRGVAGIFIAYGAAVGVVGAALGAALGYTFVVNINTIQDFLVRLFGWRVWSREVYSFDEIPNTVRAADLVTVVLLAILLSMLGSLLAAWRAGRMQPVEALRYE